MRRGGSLPWPPGLRCLSGLLKVVPGSVEHRSGMGEPVGGFQEPLRRTQLSGLGRGGFSAECLGALSWDSPSEVARSWVLTPYADSPTGLPGHLPVRSLTPASLGLYRWEVSLLSPWDVVLLLVSSLCVSLSFSVSHLGEGEEFWNVPPGLPHRSGTSVGLCQ